MSGADRYDVVVDPLAEDSHGKLARLVGRDKRVLELGCATGGLTRLLATWGCTVTAVELDAEAAEQAAPACDRVIIGDLDVLDLEKEAKGERFDVVVAGDVLEHLTDPGRVLRQLGGLLTRGGYIAVTVPNVAHGSVRLALLHGDFPRSDTGLLDDTHVQFFTRGQIIELLEANGWVVVHEDATRLALEDSEVGFADDDLTRAVRDEVVKDPLAWVYQFVLVGVPAGEVEVFPGLLQRSEQEVRDLRAGLEEALAVVEGGHGRIAAVEGALEAATVQLSDARMEIELAALAETDRQFHQQRIVDRFDRHLAHLDALRKRTEVELAAAEDAKDELAAQLADLRDNPPPVPVPAVSDVLISALARKLRSGRERLRSRGSQ